MYPSAFDASGGWFFASARGHAWAPPPERGRRGRKRYASGGWLGGDGLCLFDVLVADFLIGVRSDCLGDTLGQGRDGRVTGHVGCGAEGVLSQVQGNHQGNHGGIETKHGLQQTDCGHHATAGNAGGCNHHHAEHQNHGNQ